MARNWRDMKKEIIAATSIDHMSSTYLEYMEKRKTIKILTDEMEKLEAKLREEVGTYEAATIFGELVITNRPTKRLREKALAEDNPQLYQEYVKPVLVDKFDGEAFQKDHPAIYRQYQSRSFLFKEAK